MVMGPGGPKPRMTVMAKASSNLPEPDDVDNSCYIESHDWVTVNNEVEGIWKEVVMD
jgi:hypothetical protein